MPSEPKLRANINVVLNGLVREGVIAGFKTNFGTNNEPGAPIITVTAPEGQSLDDVKVRVMDALADVVIGVSVTVEPV